MENKITKIQIQKRKKDRVNIYLDGEYSFSCSCELVYKKSLESGKKIDGKVLNEIAEEDNYICAKNYALRVIERFFKTEKQMYTKLKSKEYDEKTIARVMAFLKEYKFVDDFKYVNIYVGEKIKKQGNKKIKYDLIKKGIAEKLINDTLKNIDDDVQIEACENLAKKKFVVLNRTENVPIKIYTKLISYLLRIGYTSDIAKKTVEKIFKEQNINRYDNINRSTNLKDANKKDIKVLAEKRYNVLMKMENDKKKINLKLWNYLLRRGYKNEEIKKVLKEVESED
ncbi:MAG: recombination regulator RecX [Clostridium sp.]|nr:recombination regulator RecX [Clostridium sp.]